MEKEKAIKLSDEVTDIYIDMEYDMLMNIASLLSQNHELLEQDPRKWQIQQANNLGILNKRNIEVIRAASGLTVNQLNYILYQSGVIAMKPSEAALMKIAKKTALIVPPPVASSPIMVDIMLAFQKQAVNVLNLVNSTMISQANQVYLDIVNRTTADVLAGTKTIFQSMRSSISQWAENGVPALIDKLGRRWGAEGYVRTVMTSTIGNVANGMQDSRFEQWGVTLVEVSSHIGARPKCAPYQGKIYTIANDPGYPNLYKDTSYGDADGLFGINCGHNKYAFIEGESTQRYYPYPEEQNEKIYKESQQQRSIERKIRKAKTRKAMLEELGDVEGAKAAGKLVSKRQGEMRSFIEDTGRTRRRDREQIIATKPTPKEQPPESPFNKNNEAAMKDAMKRDLEKMSDQPVVPDKQPDPAPEKPTKKPVSVPKKKPAKPKPVPEKKEGGLLKRFSAKVEKSLRTLEKKIMNKPFETAGVISISQEKKVWEQKGKSKSVSLTGAIEGGFIGQDHIITHNHPAVVSFSPADLRALIKHNFHTIRAQELTGVVYSATLGKAIASLPESERLELAQKLPEVYKRHETELYNDYVKAGKEGKVNKWILDEKGEVIQNRLQALFYNIVVQRVADEIGFEYEREGAGEYETLPERITE